MITIKIKRPTPLTCTEELKTTTCPKCNHIIHSWSHPILMCRHCSMSLVNINNIIDYPLSRLMYHMKGSY